MHVLFSNALMQIMTYLKAKDLDPDLHGSALWETSWADPGGKSHRKSVKKCRKLRENDFKTYI